MPCNNTSNKFSRNCNPSPLRILNHQTPFITCEISFYFNKNFKTWYLFTLCNDMYFNEPSLLLFTSNSPRKKIKNWKKWREMKWNLKWTVKGVFVTFSQLLSAHNERYWNKMSDTLKENYIFLFSIECVL